MLHVMSSSRELQQIFSLATSEGYCSTSTAMCFTETRVQIYHYMLKTSTLYCDATVSIVPLSTISIVPLFTTAFVVQHPKGDSPVAVAEMITTEHNITAVSHFLECFRREETTILGWKNTSTPNNLIVID